MLEFRIHNSTNHGFDIELACDIRPKRDAAALVRVLIGSRALTENVG